MNNKTSFLVQSLKLSTFGFHLPWFGSEPMGRGGEGDRPGSQRSERIKNGVEAIVVVGNQVVGGGRIVSVQEAVDTRGKCIRIHFLNVTE